MNPAFAALLSNPRKMIVYLAVIALIVLMFILGIIAAFPASDPPTGEDVGELTQTSFGWSWYLGIGACLLVGQLLANYTKLTVFGWMLTIGATIGGLVAFGVSNLADGDTFLQTRKEVLQDGIQKGIDVVIGHPEATSDFSWANVAMVMIPLLLLLFLLRQLRSTTDQKEKKGH